MSAGRLPQKSDRLLDIPCKVCGDRSSGKHYGIYSCDGCSGFFKRSIHKSRVYTCKAQGELKGRCPIDKTHRNQCRACRLARCFQADMNKDAVQHERGPRKPKLKVGVVGEGPEGGTGSGMGLMVVGAGGGGGGAGGTGGGGSVGRVTLEGGDAPMDLTVGGPCSRRLLPYKFTSSASDMASHHHAPPPHPHPHPHPHHPALPPHSSYHSALLQIGYHVPPPWGDLARMQTPSAFQAPLGPVVTTAVQPDLFQEVMARLLFTLVTWVRHVPCFLVLPQSDQTALLGGCWKDLFLLGLVQWGLSLEASARMIDTCRSLSLDERQKLTDILTRMRELNLDPTEFTCLKAVLLFGPEVGSLVERKQVEAYEEQAQLMLTEHVQLAHPRQVVRVGRLLLLPAKLHAVPGTVVERTFFRGLVGAASIPKLIANILHSDLL
ncbi:nuclear receptor subfamily 2 group E member 1-like [Babylonia areolata]|uniref:nuclear receptor subfamily 2 group E member 1-like n=1 Tax=Babylonia areolata TaxID=304850 RepID=UPI003FD4C7DD